MRTPDEQNLQVALSGGGFRAAAFGLGVLLYLAHSGLNRRVSTIASVSGGSLTNGYVASKCDFRNLERDDFWPFASGLAQTLSGNGKYRGFFLWGWPFVIALATIGLVLLWWLLTIAESWRVGSLLPPVSRTKFLTFLVSTVVWGVVGLNRDALVRTWIRWTFFRPKRSLSFDPPLATDHVFCATDLTSSSPLFFSTNGEGRIFSKRYGRGQGKDIALHFAVAASAAFPPVISPAPLRILHRGFARLPKDLTTVWLTDGGVWNNLGTDWNHLYDSVLAAETEWIQRSRSVEHSVAERVAKASCPPSGVLLIANASKPDEWQNLWKLKVPGISFLVTTMRVLSVAVNSTIVGRTDDIERISELERVPGRTEPVLVQMTRRPDSEPHAAESPVGAVELEAIAALRPCWDADEIVPTTFNNIGPHNTLRMIVRGYLNTRRATAGRFGHVAPMIPRRDWFEQLLQPGAPPPAASAESHVV